MSKIFYLIKDTKVIIRLKPGHFRMLSSLVPQIKIVLVLTGIVFSSRSTTQTVHVERSCWRPALHGLGITRSSAYMMWLGPLLTPNGTVTISPHLYGGCTSKPEFLNVSLNNFPWLTVKSFRGINKRHEEGWVIFICWRFPSRHMYCVPPLVHSKVVKNPQFFPEINNIDVCRLLGHGVGPRGLLVFKTEANGILISWIRARAPCLGLPAKTCDLNRLQRGTRLHTLFQPGRVLWVSFSCF